MNKPRDYELGKNKNEENVVLSAFFDDEERIIYLSGNYSRRLRPRSARALAKRLNEMADWADALKGGK